MSDPFDVSDQLVFTAQPPGHVNTGAAFTVIVEAEDGAGTLDSSFHGTITLSDKTFKSYPGLYHEIFNELERATVLKDVSDWILARLKS